MRDNFNGQEIRKKVEARNKELEKYLKSEEDTRKNTPKEKKKISRFIRDCLQANDLGDGLLYAFVNRGQYILNENTGEIYCWQGHFWKIDYRKDSLAAVENVAIKFLKEAECIDREIYQLSKNKNENESQIKSLENTRKKIFKRVKKLRSNRGRKDCFEFAFVNSQNSLTVKGEAFNKQPMKLATPKGAINLQTGEIKRGIREDYISKSCPTEYPDIDAPAPMFELFMKTIFKGNMHLVEYMQRLLGYSITGLSSEHVLPVLYGQGRNGKGTLVKVVQYVLGQDLAAPIRPEMLLFQRHTQSASAPNPETAALNGLRIAFASETEEGQRFSTSKAKRLSGGDNLAARSPYEKKEIYFSPTHTLFLITNEKPHAPAHDFAFWERVHLIPFDLSFVTDREPAADNERQADTALEEKLFSEAPGILAWLVRGCLNWQERGLDPPPAVRDATKKYRREEDILADWMEDRCYLGPDAEDTSKNLYTDFKSWYEENVFPKAWSQKKWGKIMGKQFKREKKGVYVYYGINLNSKFDFG